VIFTCTINNVLPYRIERQLDEVIIALVGKYTALEDAYASVLKALNHAALFCNRKLKVLVRYSFLLIYIHQSLL
jgi:CTP synthase (UTP-ammonia lyase)